MIVLKTESRIQSRLSGICVAKAVSFAVAFQTSMDEVLLGIKLFLLSLTEGCPLVCPASFQTLQMNQHISFFLCFLTSGTLAVVKSL
jgi:hypothetical protein